MGLIGMFDTEALECAQIIPIAQLVEELFLNGLEAVPALGSELALDMVLEVILNAVIFKQRVIHIDQENDCVGRCHKAAPKPSGTDKPPSLVTGAPATSTIKVRNAMNTQHR